MVSHGGTILTGVPVLARNLDPRFPMGEGRSLRNCGVVDLARDPDGWRVVRLAGRGPGRLKLVRRLKPVARGISVA